MTPKSTAEDTVTPDLMPVLRRGAHLSPSDGACLMEYVAVLAGEPFGDSPRCTDPLLATLARLVNDNTSDTARPLLAALAPDLTRPTPRTRQSGPAIVAAALAPAASANAGDRTLARHLRRARRRLRRTHQPPHRVAALREALYRRGAARHALAAAVGAAVQLPVDQRDKVLRDMLTAAVEAARASSIGSKASAAGQLSLATAPRRNRP